MFNRNKVKMSYRNTSNLKKIIASQNSKNIRKSENNDQNRTCNCPKTKPCPLQGKCLLENVVYQAMVKTDNSEETYVGLASTTSSEKKILRKNYFFYKSFHRKIKKLLKKKFREKKFCRKKKLPKKEILLKKNFYQKNVRWKI